MRAHCVSPPPEMAHWTREHGVFYNQLETFGEPATARAFMERYAVVLRRTGWKVLVAAG